MSNNKVIEATKSDNIESSNISNQSVKCDRRCLHQGDRICYNEEPNKEIIKKVAKDAVLTDSSESINTDSLHSGESLFKTFSFDVHEDDSDAEKCMIFWKNILGKNVKPIKCSLLKSQKGKEEKKEKEKMKAAKEEDCCDKEATREMWLGIYKDLQRRNLDKIKLVKKKTCDPCEEYIDEESEKKRDLEDIKKLNDWKSKSGSSKIDVKSQVKRTLQILQGAQQPPQVNKSTDEATERKENKSKDEATEHKENKPKDQATEQKENKPKDEATEQKESKPKDEATKQKENKSQDEATEHKENKPKGEATERKENKPKDEATEQKENKPKDEVTKQKENKSKDEATKQKENKPKDEATKQKENKSKDEATKQKEKKSDNRSSSGPSLNKPIIQIMKPNDAQLVQEKEDSKEREGTICCECGCQIEECICAEMADALDKKRYASKPDDSCYPCDCSAECICDLQKIPAADVICSCGCRGEECICENLDTCICGCKVSDCICGKLEEKDKKCACDCGVEDCICQQLFTKKCKCGHADCNCDMIAVLSTYLDTLDTPSKIRLSIGEDDLKLVAAETQTDDGERRWLLETTQKQGSYCIICGHFNCYCKLDEEVSKSGANI